MMPTQRSFVVRPAIPEEWPSLSPLFAAMGQVDDEIKARMRLTAILGRSDHLVLVAITAGEFVVAGYAWAQDYGPHLRSGKSIARLHDFYVGLHFRRCGAGTRLLEEVQRWALDRDVTWLQ